MLYAPTAERSYVVLRLLSTRDDVALTILRLGLGVVMFPHGAQKMLGWFGGQGYTATMAAFTHSGVPAFLAFLVIAAEFFGSIGLILGCLTRIAAFGIACVMAVAIVKVHAHIGFFMNWAGTQRGEGFEYHILALSIALALMLAGAGASSIDRLLARRTG